MADNDDVDETFVGPHDPFGISRFSRNSQAAILKENTDEFNRGYVQYPENENCDDSEDNCDQNTLENFEQESDKIQKIAVNMCCSKHFIRHYHEENGGGYGWDPEKLNTVDPVNFKVP